MKKFHFTYISSISRASITWQIALLTEYVQMFQRVLFPDLSYYKCTFNPCNNPVRVVVASAVVKSLRNRSHSSYAGGSSS